MNDQGKIVLGALVGAALGGLVGFLFFTERGERVRADVGPRLQGLLDEARKLRGTVESLKDTAGEGWQAVKEAAAGLADESELWAEHGPTPPAH